MAWIKDDIYDWLYHVLDILGFSFVIKIAKILVDRETAATTI